MELGIVAPSEELEDLAGMSVHQPQAGRRLLTHGAAPSAVP